MIINDTNIYNYFVTETSFYYVVLKLSLAFASAHYVQGHTIQLDQLYDKRWKTLMQNEFLKWNGLYDNFKI